MFNTNDKVYFGRGPVEFVGIVLTSESGKVTVSGVETGCLSTRRATVTVERLENLRKLDVDEWERRIANEPAFADSMAKARFSTLQTELERLEMSIAKGEETDATDFRIQEIELLMENSPWMMCPGNGCILKANKPQGASLGM